MEIQDHPLLPILRDLRGASPGIHIDLDTSDEPALTCKRRGWISRSAAARCRRGGSSSDAASPIIRGRSIAAATMLDATAFRTAAGETGEGIPSSAAAAISGSPIAWLKQYRPSIQVKCALRYRIGVARGRAFREWGLTILLAFLADREPDLVRCIPAREDDTTGLWLSPTNACATSPHPSSSTFWPRR